MSNVKKIQGRVIYSSPVGHSTNGSPHSQRTGQKQGSNLAKQSISQLRYTPMTGEINRAEVALANHARNHNKLADLTHRARRNADSNPSLINNAKGFEQRLEESSQHGEKLKKHLNELVAFEQKYHAPNTQHSATQLPKHGMLKIHQPPQNPIVSGRKSLPLKSKKMFNLHSPKGGRTALIIGAASFTVATVGTIAFNLFNKKINLTADSKN
jgi:hypothetical protein